MATILSCVDQWDRTIDLDEHIWRSKIVRGGTRLPESALDAIRRTITQPDIVTFDKIFSDGECFYGFGVLPGNLSHLYLKVCVKVGEDDGQERTRGQVITAYPTDRIPQSERQKWP